MPDDFARATASGMPVTIAGKQYLAGKYTPRDLGDLQAWLKTQKPDPRLRIRELCAGLSDGVAIRIWEDLQDEAQDWPPSLSSAEGNMILLSCHEGAAMIAWVSLRRHTPSVDLAEARRIAMDITGDELGELIRLGFPEPTLSPKSEGSSTEGLPAAGGG